MLRRQFVKAALALPLAFSVERASALKSRYGTTVSGQEEEEVLLFPFVDECNAVVALYERGEFDEFKVKAAAYLDKVEAWEAQHVGQLVQWNETSMPFRIRGLTN